MILMLQKNTPEPAIRQLLAQLSLQNVKGGCVAGDSAILLPLVAAGSLGAAGAALRDGGAAADARLPAGQPRRPPGEHRGHGG